MGQLCELVRRFNHRSYEEVVGFAWGEIPRCREFGLDALDPTAHELTRQQCRLFLEAAIDELGPLHPPPVGDVSPIEILRRHVLEGDTWDVVLAERKEQGLPRLSERTLKNRQRQGYRLIVQWTSGRPTGEEQQLDLPFRHTRERVMRYLPAMAGMIVAALVVWGLIELRPATGEDPVPSLEQELRGLDRRFLGRPLTVTGPGDAVVPNLRAILPQLSLPELPRAVNRAMLLPPEDDGIPLVLLTTDSGGNGGGTAWLWHPIENRFWWKLEWQPPSEEIRTHESLVEPIHEEAWGIRGMAYRHGEATLGDRIALVYEQRYSPTFVLFVDRHTGTPLWHYAHPGHLAWPFIVDLNLDGRPEVLLSGTDNVCNCAVLVVLDPRSDANGAASDVMWNEQGEGALFRVRFPTLRAMERHFGVPRQSLLPLHDPDWLPEKRLLVVRSSLGATVPKRSTFLCYLYEGWNLLEEGGLQVEDNSIPALWEPAGLDFESMRDELARDVQLIPGRGFEAFVEAGSP
jgi:hypothetical protein